MGYDPGCIRRSTLRLSLPHHHPFRQHVAGPAPEREVSLVANVALQAAHHFDARDILHAAAVGFEHNVAGLDAGGVGGRMFDDVVDARTRHKIYFQPYLSETNHSPQFSLYTHKRTPYDNYEL